MASSGKKAFVNPLLQPSIKNLNLPEDNKSKTEVVTEVVKPKKERFEDTHERFTGWARKDLKKAFEDLVTEKGTSKTALLNEALELLLHKQDRKPYTKRVSD